MSMRIKNKYVKSNASKAYTLNFGPQHPAAHGVLRLILHTRGETVEQVDPHIGLLHRGTEKLIETKSYVKSVPYFDRLDYVSTISQEHSFVLCLEHLRKIKVPLFSSLVRMLFTELTRILNHIMAITTHALDIGAITPFLWGFEERERLMQIYEALSGARMHTAYLRVGGYEKSLPVTLLSEIEAFCTNFTSKLIDMEKVLNNNPIWKHRLQNVGKVTKALAREFSFSGVMLRSSGIPFDLRKWISYEQYDRVAFNICVSKRGDSFTRYLLRVWEMRESAKIITKVMVLLKNLPGKREASSTMEAVIKHFKLWTGGNPLPTDACYTSTESPKGEFGVFVVGGGTENPQRCRIRSPGFYHLQSLNTLCKEYFIADVVTLIGTQDLVFGEIDR